MSNTMTGWDMESRDDDPIAELLEQMESADVDQRRRVFRETVAFLSARLDRSAELGQEQAETIQRQQERIDELERRVAGLIELAEMAGQVTANLLAGAPWRPASNDQ